VTAPAPSFDVGGLSIAPPRTKAELQEFIELPLRLHPRDRYVPLWQDTVTSWWQGLGPHTAHGSVIVARARDAHGTVVGRTTVHTDSRMDEKLGTRAQLMGATEFTGPDVLAGLTAYAEWVARQDDRTTLLGPVSLLPNQTGGVITSGFGERGFVDSPWNPEHYPAAWEAAGFTPVWPAATWVCEDLAAHDPDEVFPRGAGPLPAGVELHHGRRRGLSRQLGILRSMLNPSFAQLPYYTQITAEELSAATDGLAWLLDEDLLLWLTVDGEPSAFVLVVPDLTAFVQSTGGRMALRDQVRLLLTRRRYRRDAVLIIKGTVPEAQGRGLMSVLSHRLLANLRAGGYESLRVTFIGEDNPASAAQFAAMGGRPLHGVTFYRKDLV